MDKDIVAVGGFAVLFVLLGLRVPVGVAMGVVGVGGFALLVDPGAAYNVAALSPIRTMANFEFGLIPLFILLGTVASESGISRELFSTSNVWLGHRRGGLAMATVAASGGFAAICGSSVATAATMTKLALPEMRRHGYAEFLSSGTIAAGGTLGILIPPSVILALYGILTEQDIGLLFMAGLVPGLLAVVFYLVTVQVIAWRIPTAMNVRQRAGWRERLTSVRGVWPMVVLFVFVIGGIYAGVFTPTEAAGMGAAGAILISIARRRLPWPALTRALVSAVRTTASIFMVLIGAVLFGYFLAITQTPQNIAAFLAELPIGRYGVLLLILAGFLALGCILDAMAMLLLMVPVIFPVMVELGFDPIWFGVIMVMVIELGLITPPIGMNVFVIKTVAPELSLGTIYKGVLPFIGIDLVRLGILIGFPQLVLWLPSTMS